MRFLIFSWIMVISSHQSQLERDPNAFGARRRRVSTPRSHSRHKRRRFHEGYRKIPRRSMQIASDNQNVQRDAVQAKHSVRRKWRFFTFSRIISRRTMNLTFPDASGVDFVLFCRWYRVSTTLLSRVVDDRSNTAWRWRLNSTTIIEWRTMCLWGTHLYSVYGAGGCGEVKGVSRFARI